MMSLIHHQYLIIDNELYKDYLNTISKEVVPMKKIESFIKESVRQINE